MNFPDANLPLIVIVDDSQDDAFLLRHYLRLGGIANPVSTFEKPMVVLAYLRSTSAINVLPELFFVDIKMPGACDLIAEIRSHHEWDDIKVVIATYSNEPADIQRALELRANGYLLKFPGPDNLAEFVRHGPWFANPRRVDAATHALCA